MISYLESIMHKWSRSTSYFFTSSDNTNTNITNAKNDAEKMQKYDQAANQHGYKFVSGNFSHIGQIHDNDRW